MSIATQAGVANTLTALSAVLLGLDWVDAHARRLATVDSEDIYDIGVFILAPCRLAAIVIGNATHRRTAQGIRTVGRADVTRP